MNTRRIAVLATATLAVASVACHKTPPAPPPSPALQSRGPDADSLRRAQADNLVSLYVALGGGLME